MNGPGRLDTDDAARLRREASASARVELAKAKDVSERVHALLAEAKDLIAASRKLLGRPPQ